MSWGDFLLLVSPIVSSVYAVYKVLHLHKSFSVTSGWFLCPPTPGLQRRSDGSCSPPNPTSLERIPGLQTSGICQEFGCPPQEQFHGNERRAGESICEEQGELVPSAVPGNNKNKPNKPPPKRLWDHSGALGKINEEPKSDRSHPEPFAFPLQVDCSLLRELMASPCYT